jgi:hypothetical protein
MTEASNFKDNNDGTVTDLEEDLCWCKKDSRAELEKWLNWDEAMEYVRVCNDQKYLGSGDWRIPTKSELRALLKNKNDYKQIFLNEPPKVTRKVSDYKSGGEQSLWSSETRYGSYAWKSYFPSGKEVCVDQSVATTGTSVRLVRDV